VDHLVEIVKRYEAALRGIAACATVCACCEMQQRIASKALEKHVGLETRDGGGGGEVPAVPSVSSSP